MIVAGRMYRACPPDLGPRSLVITLGAVLVLEPAMSPDRPRIPRVRYRCDHGDCPTREVDVRLHYVDEEPPECAPTVACPACGRPLRFCHYLHEAVLEPVGPQPGTAAATPASDRDWR